MEKPKEKKWMPIQLPKELVENLEVFVNSGTSRGLGFTNKSQIAANAIREFLRNYSNYSSYLDYLEFENNQVKVMDHELGKVVEIKFDYEDTTLFCQNHDSDYCNHVRFVWTLPRFKEKLKEFKKPTHKLKPKIHTKKETSEVLQKCILTSAYNKSKDKKISKKKMIEILNEIIKDLE